MYVVFNSDYLEDHIPDNLEKLHQGAGKTLQSWSVQEVCDWLKHIEMDQYKEVFQMNCIDGAELVNLTEDMLQTSLGVG